MNRAKRQRQAGITLMELLIVCVIGSIVTGGMIMLWFNINKSSAMTASQAKARDFARSGIARLSREIRDAEALPSEEAVVEAAPNSIAFTTTFNDPDNEVDTTAPRLVRYVVENGRMYRELHDGGVETTTTVIPHLLNDDAEPVFSYTYLDESGSPQPEPSHSPLHEVADDYRGRILLVRIHVLVDLDPGKSPNAMDITTQAQLRNQRTIIIN